MLLKVRFVYTYVKMEMKIAIYMARKGAETYKKISTTTHKGSVRDRKIL